MNQSGKLKKFSIIKDSNETGTEMVGYYLLFNGERIGEINKRYLQLYDIGYISWWKLGKLDESTSILQLETNKFQEKLRMPIQGTSRNEDKVVGNFIVMEFNESNYLKISSVNNSEVKFELVNFQAPYPHIQDTRALIGVPTVR